MVEWSPRNWAIMLTAASGIVLFIAAIFAWLFRMGDRAAAAIVLRTLLNSDVQKSLSHIFGASIVAHNEQPDAHYRQAAESRNSAFREIAAMIRTHNEEAGAHKVALDRYATRDELNGAIERVVNEMKYGFKLIQKDVHRLNPERFSQEEDVIDPDFDATNGRKKR